MIRMLWMLAMLLPATAVAGVTPETCAPFYQALQQVPHESIFQQDGLYPSQRFATGVTGCLVVMVTGEARLGTRDFPALTAGPGTPLYRAGWRSNPKYQADGPGSSVVGLEKDGALCLVSIARPAYVDDAGRIVQHAHVNARVECLEGGQGRCPQEMMCE